MFGAVKVRPSNQRIASWLSNMVVVATCSVNGTGKLHEGDGIMKKACLQILQPPQINS